jgi:hypothetical protein
LTIALTPAEQSKLEAKRKLAQAKHDFAEQLRAQARSRGKSGKQARQGLWIIGEHDEQLQRRR